MDATGITGGLDPVLYEVAKRLQGLGINISLTLRWDEFLEVGTYSLNLHIIYNGKNLQRTLINGSGKIISLPSMEDLLTKIKEHIWTIAIAAGDVATVDITLTETVIQVLPAPDHLYATNATLN